MIYIMTYTNHFIYSYFGNKRTEAKDIIDNITNITDYKNIIEPFCGSSAISFYIWLIHKDEFNYYLNDNNNKLIEIYDLLKMVSLDEISSKLKTINEEINAAPEPKTFYTNIYKKPRNIYDYIYINKYYNIRPGLYKYTKNIKSLAENKNLKLFVEFIKSPYVYINCDEWTNCYNKFKNDDKSIILLDPPYITGCNDLYHNPDTNLYENFYNNPIENFKASIFLILENVWLIKLLFKKSKILFEYDKNYLNHKKRKTTHIIISNK
jgi:hypothetical protein